jgi:hypothetical protein
MDVKKGPSSRTTIITRMLPKYSETPNLGMVVVACMIMVLPQMKAMKDLWDKAAKKQLSDISCSQRS